MVGSSWTRQSKIDGPLGVRYMLEGSVRKAGDWVRITAQLVEATTGYPRWAERYDRSLQEIFVLQDEIRQKIVMALKVQLTQEEQVRFRRFPTHNLEAYDALLRGLERRHSLHAIGRGFPGRQALLNHTDRCAPYAAALP